jgi:GDP-4-dehydro-6-deoxy-D-mannose reductase
MPPETILITGACGMVGSHLGEYFAAQGNALVIGTRFHPTIDTSEVEAHIRYIDCDIRDAAMVQQIITQYLPNRIFHLAAQSYPTVSWEKPVETMDTNVNGTIHVFESIKHCRLHHSDYNPVVVVACSSAEYGSSLTPENTPVHEDTALLPLHPYGVSKVAQDLLTYQYFMNDGIRGIRARIFNTTGVRKINDVVSDFTRKAVLIERGQLNEFKTGNLSTRRSIADVRDLVQALVLLSEKGKAGEVYNISGQQVYEIREIIDCIRQLTGLQFEPVTDPSLMRSTDEPVIFGDSSRLIADTGWQQHIPLQQTIADMLAYWRKKIN